MELVKIRRRDSSIIYVVIFLCISSFCLMLFVLFKYERVVQKEFEYPTFDENVEKGIPCVPDEMGWNELDVTVFKVSVCGRIRICDNEAKVYFTNPVENNVWMKLRILNLNGKILGESGIIKNGEYIESICFAELPKENDTIYLKVMAYEPNTYYSEGSIILETVVEDLIEEGL